MWLWGAPERQRVHTGALTPLEPRWTRRPHSEENLGGAEGILWWTPGPLLCGRPPRPDLPLAQLCGFSDLSLHSPAWSAVSARDVWGWQSPRGVSQNLPTSGTQKRGSASLLRSPRAAKHGPSAPSGAPRVRDLLQLEPGEPSPPTPAPPQHGWGRTGSPHLGDFPAASEPRDRHRLPQGRGHNLKKFPRGDPSPAPPTPPPGPRLQAQHQDTSWTPAQRQKAPMSLHPSGNHAL